MGIIQQKLNRKRVFKHEPLIRLYFSPYTDRNYFGGNNAMINEYFKAGDRAIWCGFDEVEIVDISGEWATIRFPDTHSTTITNTKHLEECLNDV